MVQHGLLPEQSLKALHLAGQHGPEGSAIIHSQNTHVFAGTGGAAHADLAGVAVPGRPVQIVL